MRANSLLLACFLVLFWASTGSQTALAAEKVSADDLLLEAFKAEKAGGDSIKVADKFEAVLKADPENYFALIKLGLMSMGDGTNPSGTRSPEMDATEYFLRAALARPSSPEAYLYLADLNYRKGYITEGDRYLKMSQSLGRHAVYDDVCLTGWRYEDTGNYYAAILAYAAPVLSPDSEFRGDPYLMKRLQTCALLSPPPYDWAMIVMRLLYGDAINVRTEKLRNAASALLIHYPSLAIHYSPDYVVNIVLRKHILAVLENNVPRGDKIPDRHELPKVMYRLFYCNPDEIPEKRFADPYEAFVKASPGTPEDYKLTLAELKNLREKALAAVGNDGTPEERARRLFVWLKRNVLQEYHYHEGISAKSVVEDKKYLCLSGSILYTLLARDAKLDVKGYLVPGHAYAVLDGDKRIRVETTTDGPEGFDFKPGADVKSRERDRALVSRAFQVEGVVPDPMKLVACQYINTTITSIDDLVLNKYEKLFRQVLKSKMGMDDMKQTEAIELWRRYGIGSSIFHRLIRTMAEKDNNFREDLIKQIDKNVQMMKTARGLSPFDLNFRELIDKWTVEAAKYECLPAEAAMRERAEKRMNIELQQENLKDTVPAEPAPAGKASTPPAKTTGRENKVAGSEDSKKLQDKASMDAELEKINEEEKKNWETERQYWLKGLKRLSAAVKQYPCNQAMREQLEGAYRQARGLAEQRRDVAALDEMKTYAIGLLP